MIDYKKKIKERWNAPTEGATGELIRAWLDETNPGWKEEAGDMAAEIVLEEALGSEAWGKTEVEASEEMQAFVNEHYLMMGAA